MFASSKRQFEDEAAYEEMKFAFARNAQRPADDGAEVIIQAGGLPMLPLSRERERATGNALASNGIAIEPSPWNEPSSLREAATRFSLNSSLRALYTWPVRRGRHRSA
jgi:allantoin racemase